MAFRTSQERGLLDADAHHAAKVKAAQQRVKDAKRRGDRDALAVARDDLASVEADTTETDEYAAYLGSTRVRSLRWRARWGWTRWVVPAVLAVVVASAIGFGGGGSSTPAKSTCLTQGQVNARVQEIADGIERSRLEVEAKQREIRTVRDRECS